MLGRWTKLRRATSLGNVGPTEVGDTGAPWTSGPPEHLFFWQSVLSNFDNGALYGMLLNCSISAEKLVVIHQGMCKLSRNMWFWWLKVNFKDTRIFSRTMGASGRFYLKLVKATLITIVMLGHHGRGTMDMLRGTMDMSMMPHYCH